MAMYELFYRVEVNGICMLILAWIIFRSRIINDKQTRNILYNRGIISTLVLIFIDTLTVFFEGIPGTLYYIINWILYSFYIALNGYTAYAWFTYVIYSLFENKRKLSIANVILAIPLAAFVILSLISFLTRWIFYIDPKTNSFSEGKLYFLQIIITYGFFTSAAFISLLSLIRKKHKLYRTYVVIISLIVLPFSGGLFHMLFPEAKIVWQMLALGFLLIYVEIQFNLISKDSLTGLNNRRAFENRLEKIAEDGNSDLNGKNYYIFMIDINLFKNINDNFGHPEGDKALVSTAEILRKHFGNTNAVISRYGGDEFAVIHACTAAEAGKSRLDLYRDFALFSEEENDSAYNLSISMGYAAIEGKGIEAAKAALKKADNELYREKESMHQAIEQLQKLGKKSKLKNPVMQRRGN